MLPNEVTLKLGQFIANRRKEIGMSEYDLAQELDESVFYVRQAEQGMIDPEIPELINIVRSLNMTMREFGAAIDGLNNLF